MRWWLWLSTFILRIGAGSDDNGVHYEKSLSLTDHACPLTLSPGSSDWFKSAIQPPQVCLTWKECHIFPTCECAAKVLRFRGRHSFNNLKNWVGYKLSSLLQNNKTAKRIWSFTCWHQVDATGRSVLVQIGSFSGHTKLVFASSTSKESPRFILPSISERTWRHLEWEGDIRIQNCPQNKIKQPLKTPFLMVVLTLIKIGGSS